MPTILPASARTACAAALLLATAMPATATTGPGCLYVVNLPAGDTLNMRAAPSAKSPVVDRFGTEHGILALGGKCVPLSRPWGQRWCPITHYNDRSITKGYVKARFVRDSDCP